MSSANNNLADAIKRAEEENSVHEENGAVAFPVSDSESTPTLYVCHDCTAQIRRTNLGVAGGHIEVEYVIPCQFHASATALYAALKPFADQVVAESGLCHAGITTADKCCRCAPILAARAVIDLADKENSDEGR